MNVLLQDSKRIVRSFMQSYYSDANLIQLLDHARAGQFAYLSCCCFIGLLSADHALRGPNSDWINPASHYWLIKRSNKAAEAAETAARRLSKLRPLLLQPGPIQDDVLRRRIIPMVLVEIRRRQRARLETSHIIESDTNPVLQKA
jgi:hypothetical protein